MHENDKIIPTVEAHIRQLQWRIQDFPQGVLPTSKIATIFQIFAEKLHENERIWTPRGRASLAPPWIRQ